MSYSITTEKLMKQGNVSEIIQTELDLLKEAPTEYGDFFKHAMASIRLVQSSIASIDSQGWLFIALLAQIRKHQLLSFFSAVKLHHVQAFMNLRQLLEYVADASYALANPNPDDFVETTPEGILKTPKKLRGKRYNWLKNNYPNGSKAIEDMKKVIQSSAHSNLIDTYRIFKFEYKENDKLTELTTGFFDFKDDYHIKSDLWTIGNISMGLMDLFYGINKKYKRILFTSNFLDDLSKLGDENNGLKAILMATPNFKRGGKRAKEIENKSGKDEG